MHHFGACKSSLELVSINTRDAYSSCAIYQLQYCSHPPIIIIIPINRRISDQFPTYHIFQSYTWKESYRVQTQLQTFLDEHNLMPTYQSTCKKFHSTEHCCDSMTIYSLPVITVSPVSVQLLDLTAALDTVDHELLLHRLDRTFVVRGQAKEWFESYLTGSVNTAGEPHRLFKWRAPYRRVQFWARCYLFCIQRT